MSTGTYLPSFYEARYAFIFGVEIHRLIECNFSENVGTHPHTFKESLLPEDGGSRLIRKVSIYLINYMVSHLSKQ